MSSILVVEDDDAIAQLERDYLHMSGFEVDIASDGPSGLEAALHGGYELVILDVMLPGMDGFEVCRCLREVTDVPIVMVTARREDMDKIRGLGMGADDYVEKPFSPSVLVARVRAHLSRYERLTGSAGKRSVVTLGDLELDTAARRLRVRGEEVDLKNREYELLEFLMLHPDVVFSREQLYERVWGMDALGDSATVAVHVNRLREKIEESPSSPRHILTVWGAGYRLMP
jgi:DNA-binding response OmpR family regulator